MRWKTRGVIRTSSNWVNISSLASTQRWTSETNAICIKYESKNYTTTFLFQKIPRLHDGESEREKKGKRAKGNGRLFRDKSTHFVMIREMCFGQGVFLSLAFVFSSSRTCTVCIVFEESHFACRSYSACDNAKKKRFMAATMMMMILPEVFNVGVSIQQQHFWASRASGESRKHRVICIKISFACKNYIHSHMLRWDNRRAWAGTAAACRCIVIYG